MAIKTPKEQDLTMLSIDHNSKPYNDLPEPKPRHTSSHIPPSSPAFVPTQDPNLALQSVAPKAKYELQVTAQTNSDSGHNSSQSSPSSPSSSIVGKRETSLEPLSSLPPIPLSKSKPRRPKSQQMSAPKTPTNQDRYSNNYSRQNSQIPGGQHDVQVYRVDNITYADLDPKAFLKRPENKVLPSNGLPKNYTSDYAKIEVSKSQLV